MKPHRYVYSGFLVISMHFVFVKISAFRPFLIIFVNYFDSVYFSLTFFTSNNFLQNLTSTQELLSPTTSPTTSSTASSSQSSPLSESEKHQQYSNGHSGSLYSPSTYPDSLGAVSSYDVSSKHQKTFPLPVSSLNNTQSCHSTVSMCSDIFQISGLHGRLTWTPISIRSWDFQVWCFRLGSSQFQIV